MINRRIIASGLSIVSALAVMGGATFAAFSSQASNNGNTFGAGDLVLEINGAPGSGSTPVFAIGDAAPGDQSVQSFLLTNSGSVNASTMSLQVLGVTDTVASPANLGDVLKLELFLDDGDNSFEPGTDDTLISGPTEITNATWDGLPLGFGLNGGASRRVYARIIFDSSATDAYQNEAVSFDFTFQASQ